MSVYMRLVSVLLNVTGEVSVTVTKVLKVSCYRWEVVCVVIDG